MSVYQLLNDEPAGEDRLYFGRYIDAIERKVLSREDTAPFVVGIYGRWGLGKSTLLRLLKDRLIQEDHKFDVVEFSPWMYRNEKTLLLPLLATLAKKRPPFEKLIKNIVETGPELIKTLSAMCIETATTGLPLLSFLGGIQKNKEDAKDLGERIREAVNEVTGGEKKMVFLIDDLDRCHDHNQIIGLLEQIKLFLHIERCIFFICADKGQIIKAIEETFKGEGENYLDKFVNLPIELHPHHAHHLADLLGIKDEETLNYMLRVAEILEFNPRRLKRLWNEAVMGLEIIKREVDRVNLLDHDPSIRLMVKWFLLKRCEPVVKEPTLYMQYELKGRNLPAETDAQGNVISHKELFLREFGFKKDGQWASETHRKLAVFLWNDLAENRFEKNIILNLYSKASGEDISYTRAYIEEELFENCTNINAKDFNKVDLRWGKFGKATFSDCQFNLSNFDSADLTSTTFIACDLQGVRFNNCTLENTKWLECKNMDKLDTEPVLYTVIADKVVEVWREGGKKWDRRDWKPDELFKMYKTIITLHEDRGTLTDEIKNRLLEKGMVVRDEVLALDKA